MLYLVNEGTVAPIVMAVALFVAFFGVIGLLGYVIYCDIQNRAWETQLDTPPATEPAALSTPQKSPPPG